MKRPAGINIVIGIGIFAIVLTTAYWFLWFAVPGVVQSRMPGDPGFTVYSGYELAFPLPDTFMALAALVGVFGLWRMKDWGFLAMSITAGAAFFLGLEDLLFDLENNLFVPMNGGAVVELAIVLLIMSLGPIMTILLWKHRRALVKQ